MTTDGPTARRRESDDEPRVPRRRIRTPSLAEDAYRTLHHMIVFGQLAPGERLIEPELCEALGISRTPLREALKLLAAEGLVATRRNRNAMVTLFDARELEHLFEVEAGIESFAIALAAQRMTNTELKRVEALQVRMEKLHGSGDLDTYFELNQRVHAMIVAGARNPVLEETHRRLIGRLERARYAALGKSGRWRESAHEHREILEALKARDGQRAQQLLLAHVQHTGEVIAAICDRPAKR
ncbi:DNA-binding transcriptional regulator, GntR family [Modicisalibacter muralis]|uniref:DNA-binding transcriptional regulator, GntR family n=1 Tax=Modicisalibacter muralis TaxID=119000 RepID=A0A1G9GZ59_9GAMM|nr:GntR family transcriptional regulator [Halomonas muralis]SDL05941.1 DNA-binding transcriptional regulator, GntR family [Halomonas muralis]